MSEDGAPPRKTSAQSGLTTLDFDLVSQHAAELLEHTTWSRRQLVDYQQKRLKSALQAAVDASSYYRQTIGDLVARNAPLAEFPVLTKRELMANFDHIITDPRLSRGAIERHIDGPDAGALMLGEYRTAATGGTTGERGVFVYNAQAWLSVIANTARFRRILGALNSTRVIGIGAPSPIHLSNRFYAEFRAGRSDAPALDVTMPVGDVVEALNTFQSEVVVTYPSFVRVLAQEQQSGRLRISPRYFRSGAETLTPDVRDLVRVTWNIPVFNPGMRAHVGHPLGRRPLSL